MTSIADPTPKITSSIPTRREAALSLLRDDEQRAQLASIEARLKRIDLVKVRPDILAMRIRAAQGRINWALRGFGEIGQRRALNLPEWIAQSRAYAISHHLDVLQTALDDLTRLLERAEVQKW